MILKKKLLPVVLSSHIRDIKNIATQKVLVKLETYINHIKESHLYNIKASYIRLFRIQIMSDSIFNVARVFTEL